MKSLTITLILPQFCVLCTLIRVCPITIINREIKGKIFENKRTLLFSFYKFVTIIFMFSSLLFFHRFLIFLTFKYTIFLIKKIIWKSSFSTRKIISKLFTLRYWIKPNKSKTNLETESTLNTDSSLNQTQQI